MNPSAFLIGAPHSGSGKTTVCLAIMAALRSRGLKVQGFKVGPDYIDPAHHAAVTGRPSHNLDTWMLPEEANRRIFDDALADADVGVVEGVMGLFDGVDGKRPDGSSAHLARLLGLPVVLVVDARAMARSAAALVQGFARFEPGVRLGGVIWNRVGSPTHRRILDEALESTNLPVSIGAVPRDPTAELPERHLGLVTPDDVGTLPDFEPRLAALAEANIDLAALLRLTRTTAPGAPLAHRSSNPTRSIAVPRDTAFCFHYEENLRLLREQGLEPVFCRPVDGDGLPPGVQGAYLGGGYPELHAERLSRNEAFLGGLRSLHEAGAPIYGECGGFMVLCKALEDLEGRRHPMAGVFPAVARMGGRAFRLGYREVRIVGVPRLEGQTARGHEFHYSRVDDMPAEVPRAYRVRNARGEELPPEGYLAGRTLAGYIHLHFASNPDFPRLFFS